MTAVSIVGFGRFGKTLYRLIKNDFFVVIFDKDKIDKKNLTENTKVAKSVEEIYESEAVFFAVPISSFEEVISNHRKYFKKDQLLIDVLSVKLHPAEIFKKYLKDGRAQALLTHPMFGPDSSKDGFDNLPIIIDKFMTDDANFYFWKEYFKSKNFVLGEWLK